MKCFAETPNKKNKITMVSLKTLLWFATFCYYIAADAKLQALLKHL